MEECPEVTDFKASISFEARLTDSNRILRDSARNVPVIVVKSANCDYNVSTTKLSLLRALSIAHVLFQFRKRLYLRKLDSLYLYYGRQLLLPSMRVGQLYDEYADEDGILYLVVASQEDKGF